MDCILSFDPFFQNFWKIYNNCYNTITHKPLCENPIMKRLLLMRHAKSSWSDVSLSDHDRPLNSRGKADAPRMGEHLRSTGIIPEVILCSTAKRAKQTAKYVQMECPVDGGVFYIASLYHGGPEEFIEALEDLSESVETAMIIGHNPGMEYSLEEFCGINEVLPTAAVAYIQFQCLTWKEIGITDSGKLINLWRPKEI